MFQVQPGSTFDFSKLQWNPGSLEAGEHQQLRARYKQRMERMESKLLHQRDRLEDLEVYPSPQKKNTGKGV